MQQHPISQIPQTSQSDLHPTNLSHSFHQFTHQLNHTFSFIPCTFKYTIPLIIITTNILQLSRINIINSNNLSMDPAQVFNPTGIQWWRLWSYLLAIDVGMGVWEVVKNVGLVLVVGYAMGRGVQIRVSKGKLSMAQERLSSIISQDEPISDTVNTKPLVSPLKLFMFSLLVQIPLITLAISLINCLIWFIWTSFGPHTFVSTGILPLTYFYFCHHQSFNSQNQFSQFQFTLFPIKVPYHLINILVGLWLMLFSMEAQSVLIILIYFGTKWAIKNIWTKWRNRFKNSTQDDN